MAESTRKKEKKRELTFVEKMQKLARSGLSGSACPNPASGGVDELATIDERISQVVKYLIKKGCIRVQKSIFLADLDTSVYEEIRSDLAEVQAAYENEDSILIVPLSTDYLRAMKVIGKSINLDVITHSKSTLFF